MTSQLAKQLQQLQTRPAGDEHLAKSFLFSNSDAKQISREQIHDLATSGLRTLLAVDNRFAPFLEPLFGQSTVRRERAMLTTQQNREISDKIRNVCALLSPHLFVMAAQQVFEYLIRVYEVHTYDVLTVLAMFLPYHDHAIFGRVIMLLDLRSTGFGFLNQNQESGTILPRATLVTAAAENAKVMRLICDTAVDAIRFEVPNNAAFALLAGVATACATRPENDSILRVLLPYLVSFLEEPHPIATPTALLIVCVWCREGTMTPKALGAMIRPIIASLTLSQYPVSLAERLAALGVIFKFQMVATYDVAFTPVLEALLALPSWQDWWSFKALSGTNSSALTRRLLDFSLYDVKTRSPASTSATDFRDNDKSGAKLVATSHSIQFLCVACNHMPNLTKKEIKSIFSCLVFALSVRDAERQRIQKKHHTFQAEVSDLLASCLKALERRFPLLMDEAISNALGKAMPRAAGRDDNSTNNGAKTSTNSPSYEDLIRFISIHFVGTKYEMIEIPVNNSNNNIVATPSSSPAEADDNATPADTTTSTRKVPLLTCLLHQVSEVRRLAFVALRHRVAKEVKACDTAKRGTLVNEMADNNSKSSDSSQQDNGALLPLISHAIASETSSIVATEVVGFVSELVVATIKTASMTAISGLLSAVWSMISSSLGDAMAFGPAANNAVSMFVETLATIIESEVSKNGSPSSFNQQQQKGNNTKKIVGGKAPTGLTAATQAVAESILSAPAATSATSPATSPLLSRTVYYMTVIACSEAGSAGSSNTLAALFAKLKLAVPASGFGLAATPAIAVAGEPTVPQQAAADTSSDSDDEDRKKPKKKIGEASSAPAVASSGAKGAKGFSEHDPASLVTSFCPNAIFDVQNVSAAKSIVSILAANVTVAELNTLVSSWAAKRSLLAFEDKEYASFNLDVSKTTFSALQQNMLNAHVAEGAVLAAVASFAAAAATSSESAVAFYAAVSRVLEVTRVATSAAVAAKVVNAVPTVAVAAGFKAGLISALQTSSVSTAVPCSNGLVLAKLLTILVIRFKQSLPSLDTVPAAALWALTSLENEYIAVAVSQDKRSSRIRVPMSMASGAHLYGLAVQKIGVSDSDSDNDDKDEGKFNKDVNGSSTAKQSFREYVPVGTYSRALYYAVVKAVFGGLGAAPLSSEFHAALSKDSVAFALLLPTMSPSRGLRLYAVRKLQHAALAGAEAKGKKGSSTLAAASFIAVAIRQLTDSASLSVTSINSLVEVLSDSAEVRNSAQLTEEMAKAVLDLLVGSTTDSSSSDASLSPAYVTNAIKNLFTHNKRSTQRHGELVLSRLLPIFIRPTLEKASSTPISEGEADLLFTCASMVSFGGVNAINTASCPSLEATCEVATLFLKRGGVRVFVSGGDAAASKSLAGVGGAIDVVIRSVFVPILASLTNVSPKLEASVASKDLDPATSFTAKVLTPSSLLLELLVPLFERSGAVTSDLNDHTTAAQFVVAFLTATTFGFERILSPVLPALIASLGEANASVASDEAAAAEPTTAPTRQAGKKNRTDESDLSHDKRGPKTEKKSQHGGAPAAANIQSFASLVDLATEVIAFLSSSSSSSSGAADRGSLMAGEATSAILAQFKRASGVVASRNAVLDSATVGRLFFAAFSALQGLPVNAADVALSGLPASAVVATKVNLLKFISALVFASASAEGFLRENIDAKALYRRIVAVDDEGQNQSDGDNTNANDDAEEEESNNKNKKKNNKKEKKPSTLIALAEKESALAYILRVFELSALTPFLLGQGVEDEDGTGATSRILTVTVGNNNKITASSGSVALTLSSMRAIQTFITVVNNNTVPLTAGVKNEATRERIVIDSKHRLVRQALALLSSLFVAENAAPTDAKTATAEEMDVSGITKKSHAAKTLVTVVSQLMHVISPLLSGAHASPAAAAAKPSAPSATPLGAVTSLLHIPLVALYLRLDAAAAARQEALAAEGQTNAVGSSLLADGGADYFVSSTLLDTPINICVKVLTSFAIDEQMAALCGLMELVSDPAAHLARISAAAAADENKKSSTHSNAVAELCSRLVKAGRIANRQEPILTLIGLCIKHDNFLSSFIQIQFEETHRRTKEKERDAKKDAHAAAVVEAASVTNIDTSTNCANLLVASLNLFSHYHALNAKTLADARERRRAAAGANADDDDLSDADLGDDGEEKDDEFSEEKAYTTLLELLAGNSLACVLSAINEPTFIDCQKRMLTSKNPALRQKGLETLLDRLQQSLPTAEEDSLAATDAKTAEAQRKESRDPRSRVHVLEALKLKARPQTTRLSADLIPLLADILQKNLTTDKLFTLSSLLKSRGLVAHRERVGTVQVALACTEELIRIIGNGGSKAAEKGLAKPQSLGGGALIDQTTESSLAQLFRSKSRVLDLHSIAAHCLKTLFEWGTTLTFARSGDQFAHYSLNQRLLLTTLLSPVRSIAHQKNTLQNLFILSGSCINLVATFARTLGIAFTAPHANDVLKCMSSWMSVVMQASLVTTVPAKATLTMDLLEAAAPNPKMKPENIPPPPTIDNMVGNTVLSATPAKVSPPTLGLFATLRASSPETVDYLRKALLHSVHYSLPTTWMMAHPYIPTFVSYATHNCNVSDFETAETSASFLTSLRAVLGDRGLLECICSALVNTPRPMKIRTEIASPVTPNTHSMRLIFVFVERILNEMTKEEVATIPVLITGSGTDESSPAATGESTDTVSVVGKNFWLAALGSLAGHGVTIPSAEAMGPVFDAYTAFFIKFKEKTCAQFWTKITDWAISRTEEKGGKKNGGQQGRVAKRHRGEDGGDAAEGKDDAETTVDDAAADDVAGYSQKQIAVHFVYLNLYNHLLGKLRSIMNFSFPIVSNMLVELLQRYNPTPFVKFSTAISGAGEKAKIAALLAGEGSVASDSTGGEWIIKKKSLIPYVYVTASALMNTVLLMSAAQIPEDPTLAARTGVANDIFFAKVDVFNTFMPLIMSQLANTHVFEYGDAGSFYKRAERCIVPGIRKYFACLDGPKLWSLAQKEIIKYLRHPKGSVRRAALLAMQLCYRDGGDVLCSHIMAEGLPAIVEMTEDNDKEVVEQARLLCGELSTITGQDVLHAMA